MNQKTTMFGGTPAAPLRLLLTSDPTAFDKEPRDPIVWDGSGYAEGESDREFMVRQAEQTIAQRGGSGPSGMNAAEYERIVAVWLHGEERPAIEHFSPATYSEIRRAEARLGSRRHEG